MVSCSADRKLCSNQGPVDEIIAIKPVAEGAIRICDQKDRVPQPIAMRMVAAMQ